MLGAVCISIDLELGWGIWDRPDATDFERCATRERDIVRSLLAKFEAHEFPATWAIVGRLLDLDQERVRSTHHGEKLWYAPDLIEAVQRSSIPHDIGSHSYAHIYFRESSSREIRADLAEARRVHDRHGLSFDSFVFPRNQVAHIELIREAGARVFRNVDQGFHAETRAHLGAFAGRVAHLASTVLSLAPATVTMRRTAGLVDLPSSMLFMGRKGLRRALPNRALVNKARRGLVAAAARGECFHLWLHPSNFYYRTAEQLAIFDEVLSIASELRRRRQLDVRTMRDFAA